MANIPVNLFQTGNVYFWPDIIYRMKNDDDFRIFVLSSLSMHTRGTFGNIREEDKKKNFLNIAYNTGRIISRYEKDGYGIWIDTNESRTETIIMNDEKENTPD